MPKLARKTTAEGAKLTPICIRLPLGDRQRLERQAHESGRNLTQEILHQLRISQTATDVAFDSIERFFGGKEAFALFKAMAAVADVIEQSEGKRWVDDPLTFLAVREAWDTILGRCAPQKTPGKRRQHEAPRKRIRPAWRGTVSPVATEAFVRP